MGQHGVALEIGERYLAKTCIDAEGRRLNGLLPHGQVRRRGGHLRLVMGKLAERPKVPRDAVFLRQARLPVAVALHHKHTKHSCLDRHANVAAHAAAKAQPCIRLDVVAPQQAVLGGAESHAATLQHF